MKTRGGVITGGRERTITGKSTLGLAGPGSVGTSSNKMARLPTVCAEVVICAATSFLRSEGTAITPRTVDLHGTSPSRRGKNWDAVWREGTLLLLLLMLLLLLLLLRLLLLLLLLIRPTLDRSRQIMLDGDIFSDIRLKTGRHISPGGNLKTNYLL